MSLFFQNQPKGARPQRVDDLLGNELMARIGRLDLVSRKIFRKSRSSLPKMFQSMKRRSSPWT